jgi:prepilin-type N-terminal cleavage/methylation domain-containing protein
MRLPKARGEGGYSMIELLIVMTIMGVVVGGLTTLFVQGSNAEIDMNRRFQSQQGARLAMDKLRREVHCASTISPAGSTSAIAITLAATCPTSGGQTTIRWCALQSPSPAPTGQYSLYRQTGASCTSSGTPWAENLTTYSGIFSYAIQSTNSLGKLSVRLTVNPTPAMAMENFVLADDLVLRNSTRTCTTGSPSPPC